MLYLINAVILTLVLLVGYKLQKEKTLPAIPYIEADKTTYVGIGLIVLIVLNLWAMMV